MCPSGKFGWSAARFAKTLNMDPKTAIRRIVSGEVAGEWLAADSGRRPRYFVIEESVPAHFQASPPDLPRAPAATPDSRTGGVPGSARSSAASDGWAEVDRLRAENEWLRREVRRLKVRLRGADMAIDGLQEGLREDYAPDTLND